MYFSSVIASYPGSSVHKQRLRFCPVFSACFCLHLLPYLTALPQA